MTDDTSKWDELVPEAFAEADDPLVRGMLGKVVIVRLNQVDANDELLSFEIIAGRLIRANREEGFVLELIGEAEGALTYLPLLPEAFSLVHKGDYALTNETVLRNPDFMAAFNICNQSN
jgi:hypothetical protein